MEVEKVTRDMLRSIQVGETQNFELPSAAACESAKTMAYQLQRIDGTKYTAKTDYDNTSLAITRHDNE